MVGTLISYVLPCMFFIRMSTYVRAMRAVEEGSQASAGDKMTKEEVTLDREDDENQDERDRLLETLTDEDLEKEPAHINTDVLADETFTERLLRYVCYVMITFGFLGGLISFLFTFTTIFDDFSG